jgi:hypothetical protein
MKTLSGNLREGTPPPPVAVVVDRSKQQAQTLSVIRSLSRTPSHPGEQLTALGDGKTEVKTVKPPPTTAKKIEFDIAIEGLAARLYSGSSHLVRNGYT